MNPPSSQSTDRGILSPLLTLPPEIREQIYSILLRSANNRIEPPKSPSPDRQKEEVLEEDKEGTGPVYKFDLRVLRLCRLVYTEAKKIFDNNIFVKVTTGWEKAISHVNVDGNVGLILRDESDRTRRPASDFTIFHLRVLVESPDFPYVGAYTNETFSLVTCLEDVELYARIWQFSNLSSGRALNPHLTLRLDLKNPRNSNVPLPRRLQEKLLLPFGKVKDLPDTSFDFHGSPFFPSGVVDPTVCAAVEAEQAIPTPTPSQCLEDCNRLLQSGKTLYNERKYEQALTTFLKSFEHIHIFNRGREREVHCDAYYSLDIPDREFKGQSGQHVRMRLRVELVASVMRTFVQLGQFAEAWFWGKRSIRTFRYSMQDTDEIGGEGWEDWIEEMKRWHFPGKKEMVQIALEAEGAGRALAEGKGEEEWNGEEKEIWRALQLAVKTLAGGSYDSEGVAR